MCIGAIATLVGSPSAAAARESNRVTLYSVALREQFVNNSDDRTRGGGNNPFGNYKDVTPIAQEGKQGPFPGDEAMFSFGLYKSAGLEKKVGTAVFVCQYDYKKNAFCDASFELSKQGTIIASGMFNFNAARFAMAVTGGYGAYVNTTGVLEETPSANHAQRLAFVLG